VTVIGIDLGTTNTAVGFAEPPARGAGVEPRIFDLLQIVKPADPQERPLLPSFVYQAGQGELPPGSLDLPWSAGRSFMVGTGARDRGAEVPLRLVHSSKSWLCHGGVDRRAPILPPQAPDDVEKLSPVAAATRILEHIRDAWNAKHDRKIEDEHVFLTVPASFDAVARELTMEAARSAGLENVSLLEEPQAAFYAWLAKVGDRWRTILSPKDRILVCDVGGGTTDFSLIAVEDDGSGNLTLERVAVGDHILLGGDNMDLALAHHLAERLAAEGKKLDAGQQRALVQHARRAKELLLSSPDLAEESITILGRGSKLIGSKITTALARADVESVLLNGFFPICSREDKPIQQKRTGFLELGLPFVSDAAITRHLAAFLAGRGGPPTHVLFNGGVFNSPLLRSRLLDTIRAWGREPVVLEDSENDLAVARGAAFFGAMKLSGGIRIRGGAARSYYIGIESAVPAVPGVAPPIRAMCVVPFGMEEGTTARIPGDLGLVVGEPVEFRFLSSTGREDDAIGTMLDEYTWPEHLTETAPISLSLAAADLEPGSVVPVRLEAHLTEIGTLELWSVRSDGREGRWRLEFDVRA
jgi:molecular chaperone DnaK (HSP70)